MATNDELFAASSPLGRAPSAGMPPGTPLSRARTPSSRAPSSSGARAPSPGADASSGGARILSPRVPSSRAPSETTGAMTPRRPQLGAGSFRAQVRLLFCISSRIASCKKGRVQFFRQFFAILRRFSFRGSGLKILL